jgi:FAD/FMN-containing dehydrogenases
VRRKCRDERGRPPLFEVWCHSAYIIGLEVVLASGEVLRTGGRVHKNKTGFDLIGLFVGSGGIVRRGDRNHRSSPPFASGAGHSFGRLRQPGTGRRCRANHLRRRFSPLSARDRRSFPPRSRAARSRHRDRSGGQRPPPHRRDGQPESVRSETDALRALLKSKGPNALAIATTEEGSEKIVGPAARV